MIRIIELFMLVKTFIINLTLNHIPRPGVALLGGTLGI